MSKYKTKLEELNELFKEEKELNEKYIKVKTLIKTTLM